MESWDHGPLDNETAQDWICDVMRTPAREITGALDSELPEHWRVAAFLLEQVGYRNVYPGELLEEHLDLAIERLEGLLEDEAWLASWEDPKAARRSVEDQIRRLRHRRGSAKMLAPGSTSVSEALQRNERPKQRVWVADGELTVENADARASVPVEQAIEALDEAGAVGGGAALEDVDKRASKRSAIAARKRKLLEG